MEANNNGVEPGCIEVETGNKPVDDIDLPDDWAVHINFSRAMRTLCTRCGGSRRMAGKEVIGLSVLAAKGMVACGKIEAAHKTIVTVMGALPAAGMSCD